MPILRFACRNDQKNVPNDPHLLVFDTDHINAAPWVSPLDVAAMAWIYQPRPEKVRTHHMTLDGATVQIQPIPTGLNVATDGTIVKNRQDIVLNGTAHLLETMAYDHQIFLPEKPTPPNEARNIFMDRKAMSFVVGVLEASLPSMPDAARTSPTALDTIGAPLIDRHDFLNPQAFALATDMAIALLHGRLQHGGKLIRSQDLHVFQRHALVLCDRPWGPTRMWRTPTFDTHAKTSIPSLRALGRMVAPFLRPLRRHESTLALRSYSDAHGLYAHNYDGPPAKTVHESMNARGLVVEMERALHAAVQEIGVPLLP